HAGSTGCQADDVAPLIDAKGIAIRATERPEVRHRALLPEEGVVQPGRGRAHPNHLALVVDVVRPGGGSAQRPEVRHRAVLPAEGVNRVGGRALTPTHDLARR